MKKKEQDTTFLNSGITSNKYLETEKIKTTNVNILLNRVRLNKKKTLKKRIVFTLLLASIVSSLAVYFII